MLFTQTKSEYLEKLAKIVFGKQKTLGQIYKVFGDKTVQEYVNSWQVGNSNTAGPFLKQFGLIAKRLYGQQVSEEAVSQLQAELLVSTIDHHGILGHPFFINSNTIFSIKKQKYLICLPTAGVSLNNTTSWSGCLLATDQAGILRRFSFFRDKQKTQTVLATKSFSEQDVLSVRQKIMGSAFFTDVQKQEGEMLCKSVFSQDVVFSFADFSSQAAVVSSCMWEKIFPKAGMLLYVPLEELVKAVLVNEIADNPTHILHRLLFTDEGWNILEKQYSGVSGAFTGIHKGSFLFWGVDEKGRRLHLKREGNVLVYEKYKIAGNAEEIVSALTTGILYPSSLVCFLVLLYYGVTALGGFNQVNWLTEIKNLFSNLLQSIGMEDESKRVQSVPSNNFAEGGLAFFRSQAGIIKASGLDLLFSPQQDRYAQFMELSRKLTLSESIECELPEIYKVITPREEWDTEALSVTEKGIMEENGMAKKIFSIV
jgi:hypothetical protein